MKQKTNTLKNQDAATNTATFYLARDFKHSVLIVSLLANIVMLSLWIALQVTSRYDAQLASFFFGR